MKQLGAFEQSREEIMKLFFNYLLITLLIAVISACAGTKKESRDQTLRRNIAQAYGFQYFNQVEKIQYTFNVKKGETQISRFWIWEPKANQVSFKATDSRETVTYNRNDLSDSSPTNLRNIDAWFINDSYWLLFPFHVVWDSQTIVEDVGRKKLPMGEGKARCVIVSYPATGGYTPGDAYDLFLDDDYRLTQWVYRHAGSETPTRIATWEEHRSLGPLTVSLNHQGDDPNFRVWFTTVGVKMVGIDSWIFAE